MRVTVTGAHGFVGTQLCGQLTGQGFSVDAVGRPALGGLSLTDSEGWKRRLAGVDAVVHLAARAHVTRDRAADPLALFRAVNVEGTRCVAQAAVSAGVRRFVFVSSIGVFGTASAGRLDERSTIAPQEPYAISKWEAEQMLRSLERDCGLEVVVVRPVLVYGPRVKGNFLRLMRLVASGIPLPFKAIVNTRSFIAVANLCDLLQACVVHPQAPRRTFVAADGEDISTSGLLSLISKAMGRPDRQFKLPLPVLRTVSTVLGMQGEFERLTSSLVVDAGYARATLQWQPRLPLQAGIEEMVRAFMSK